MKSSLGDIVLYSFTQRDVEIVQRGREDGTRTRFGGRLGEGQVFPAIVVGVQKGTEPQIIDEPKPPGQEMDTNETSPNPNDEAKKPKQLEFVNIQVLLDGTETYWVQGILPDKESGQDDHTPGTWRKA